MRKNNMPAILIRLKVVVSVYLSPFKTFNYNGKQYRVNDNLMSSIILYRIVCAVLLCLSIFITRSAELNDQLLGLGVVLLLEIGIGILWGPYNIFNYITEIK